MVALGAAIEAALVVEPTATSTLIKATSVAEVATTTPMSTLITVLIELLVIFVLMLLVVPTCERSCSMLCTVLLTFAELGDIGLPCQLSEMRIVEANQLLVVFVLDVLDNELDRAEGLFTDLAHVLLGFDHLAGLVLTVLIFKFNQKFVLLGVRSLLFGSSLEQFFSGLDIILFELQS